MNLSLFQVIAAGQVLVGTFSKRHQAVNAMTNMNRKLKPGERPVWVGPGPDHWRAKESGKVPTRGSDYTWKGEERVEIKPDEWLGWYTSRREEAFS